MTPICFATLLALSAAAAPQVAATGAAQASPTAAAPSGPAAAAPPTVVSDSTATPATAAAGSAAPIPLPPVAPLPAAPAEGPDVELHVPKAEVQKLSLDVENLQARLDVDTSVAQLVQIRAGVVATVQKLKAELEGVSAETHLVVRLNRVAEVMERALAAIDDKPQLAGGSAAAPQRGSAVPTARVTVDAAAEPRPDPAPAPTKPPTE